LTIGRNRDLISLLNWGKNYLKNNGIEDYLISAEILLGSILDLSRSELLMNPHEVVDQDKIDKYEDAISRRSKREPLQYLVGHVDFYNISLECDPRALIPRPETEILVEVVIEELNKVNSPKILDIGTGSGNIAVTLAANVSGAIITGLDISEGALDLAGKNAVGNNVSDRVKFISGDIFDLDITDKLETYDCIVSNPPYVAEDEKTSLQPEVIEHEPAEALFSAEDPLKFFKVIINLGPRLLSRGGLLAFETGLGQFERVKEMMSPGFNNIQSFRDLAGIERVVTGYLKNQ